MNQFIKLPYQEALDKIKTKDRSVSQLQNAVRCGYAFYLDRVVKVKGRKAFWFIQGTAVHEAISAYEKSFRQMSELEVQGVFDETWSAEMTKDLEEQPDKTMWMVGGRKKWETDRDTRFNLGRQQAIDYMRANDPDNPIKPVEIMEGMIASELGFDMDFNGTRVIGYIDLIMEDSRTGQIVPWDIKTGAHKPDDPYQMATYKHAIERVLDTTVDWGFWWMSKDNALSAPLDLRPYGFDEVAQWYNDLDKMIENELYLANPGDPCFTCTARPYCGIIQPNPLPLPDPKIKHPVDKYLDNGGILPPQDFPF